MVIGDININILGKYDPVAEEYRNVMAEYGFISTINTYTRVQGGAKSCINY